MGERVCHEDMGSDPCGQPAVGDRLDVEGGTTYPVCREHLRPPFPSGQAPPEARQLLRLLDGDVWRLYRLCGYVSHPSDMERATPVVEVPASGVSQLPARAGEAPSEPTPEQVEVIAKGAWLCRSYLPENVARYLAGEPVFGDKIGHFIENAWRSCREKETAKIRVVLSAAAFAKGEADG